MNFIEILFLEFQKENKYQQPWVVDGSLLEGWGGFLNSH